MHAHPGARAGWQAGRGRHCVRVCLAGCQWQQRECHRCVRLIPQGMQSMVPAMYCGMSAPISQAACLAHCQPPFSGIDSSLLHGCFQGSVARLHLCWCIGCWHCPCVLDSEWWCAGLHICCYTIQCNAMHGEPKQGHVFVCECHWLTAYIPPSVCKWRHQSCALHCTARMHCGQQCRHH